MTLIVSDGKTINTDLKIHLKIDFFASKVHYSKKVYFQPSESYNSPRHFMMHMTTIKSLYCSFIPMQFA